MKTTTLAAVAAVGLAVSISMVFATFFLAESSRFDEPRIRIPCDHMADAYSLDGQLFMKLVPRPFTWEPSPRTIYVGSEKWLIQESKCGS
ncbi:MAG: hypothetical protein AB7Q00_14390 [Phycisphaerales bacterium]